MLRDGIADEPSSRLKGAIKWWETSRERGFGGEVKESQVEALRFPPGSGWNLPVFTFELIQLHKGKRIGKISLVLSPKARGNLSSQGNIAATESWNLPWALASDFSTARGHRGAREEENKLLPTWGKKWPQARGQSCQNPQSTARKISFLIINLLHLSWHWNNSTCTSIFRRKELSFRVPFRAILLPQTEIGIFRGQTILIPKKCHHPLIPPAAPASPPLQIPPVLPHEGLNFKNWNSSKGFTDFPENSWGECWGISWFRIWSGGCLFV